MKKIILPLAVISVILFPLSGCKKLIDRIFHNDDGGVVSNCRISKIFEVSEFDGELITGIVYYNDRNDPDSVVIYSENGIYGPQLFYFFYDDAHNLIEYREDYDRQPDHYYSWHKYAYQNGVIVRDTARFQIAGQGGAVRNIEYDANGRVIKESVHIFELDHLPVDQDGGAYLYAYDDFGNLDGETFVYDKKVNFLRTNKIWMFTQRNYSMNNRSGVASYNESGLPLTFEDGKRPVFLIAFGISSIEYECP